MTRILLRLARDVASNALVACVERVHAATGTWLHGEDYVRANKRALEALSLQTRADRYARAARERRVQS